MCGIAGFRGLQDSPDNLVDLMLEEIKNRGPDSRGYFSSGDYQAGMCRLSIVDLRGGEQPLFSEDQDVVLLYNGEIYNSPQLRRELEASGVRFKTHSDGEVIPHLYKKYGEKLFEKLDGMYAVALWVESEKKLLLARDIPGEKPLYYTELPRGGLAFASEVRALRKVPNFSSELNHQALWDFSTFLWIPDTDTAFKNAKSVPRGHYLVHQNNQIQVKQIVNHFGQEALEEFRSLKNSGEKAKLIRREVTQAVESRLLADVPLASFLSGGLDSSIVSTIAKRKAGDLATFTIAFEDVDDPYHGKANEADAAAAYAKKLGTKHHTLAVTADDFKKDLRSFVKAADEPFGVSSGLGVKAIARAAHEKNYKVLLTGDAADELFGGYSWYSHLASLGAPQKSAHSDTSFQSFGLSLSDRLATLSNYSGPKQAWAWHYYASENDKARLFNSEAFADCQSSLRHFAAFKEGSKWEPMDFIFHDREFYFPFEMLRKADRMTMAHSVEGRVPFAAPALLNIARGLEMSDMVQGQTLKHLLRLAFADDLDPDILQRPKHGFNVPVDHWLKNSWGDLLAEALAPTSALSRHRFIHKDSLARAKEMLFDPTKLHGHSLFCLITLNMWLEDLS